MTDNDVKEMLVAVKVVSKFIDSGVDDCTDCVWHVRHESVYWNTEGNVDDLFESDGETYSVVVGYKRKETESYVIYEQCYDMCGGRCTLVFSKSREHNEDVYWENQE